MKTLDTREYWNNRATSYDVDFHSASIRIQTLNELMSRVPSPIGSFMDAGCGTGVTAKAIAETCPASTIYLMDLSEEMLSCAAGKLHDHRGTVVKLHGSFPAIGRVPEPLDLVVSSFAIHHVENVAKRATFAAFWECLRPGGLLVIADEMLMKEREMGSEELHRRMMRLFYPRESLTSRVFPEEYVVSHHHYEQMLLEAGFSGIHTTVLDPIVGLITAQK